MKVYCTASLTILFLALFGIGKIHAAMTAFEGRDDIGPRIVVLLECVEVAKAGKKSRELTDDNLIVPYPVSNNFRKNYGNIKDYDKFIEYASKMLSKIRKRGFILSKYTETVRRSIVDYCIMVKLDCTIPPEYKGTSLPLYKELHEIFYQRDTGVICKGFVEHCGGTESDRALETDVECTDLMTALEDRKPGGTESDRAFGTDVECTDLRTALEDRKPCIDLTNESSDSQGIIDLTGDD